MAKQGKRLKAASEKIEAEKLYDIAEACGIVAEVAAAKFDESVDMALHLGVDAKKSDQNVRGSVSLPNGLGKNIKVAVFAVGDLAEEAKAAGADKIGADDLAADMKEGNLDYDVVIASPDQMVNVGKIGKLLGPRGLMPSPKVGTVTRDIGSTVTAVKAGMAEFRVDKQGIVHVCIGKASMGGDKLKENLDAVFAALTRAKPQSSKGQYLKSASLSSTMGPGVKLDLAPLR